MAFISDNDTVWRFLHILSGITWIGMLYFFNLVNLPLLKVQLKKPFDVNMGDKAPLHVVAKTLFFFRWGAVFTLAFGLLLLESVREGHAAAGVSFMDYFTDRGMGGYAILLGVLLALVMFFNVWAVIWPRQQKILANNKAIAGTTDEAEKKRLGDENAPLVKEATLASRTNTWLSVPMLWGMVFGGHGYSGGTELREWLFPIVVLLAALALMAIYSQAPKKKDATPPAPPAPAKP